MSYGKNSLTSRAWRNMLRISPTEFFDQILPQHHSRLWPDRGNTPNTTSPRQISSSNGRVWFSTSKAQGLVASFRRILRCDWPSSFITMTRTITPCPLGEIIARHNGFWKMRIRTENVHDWSLSAHTELKRSQCTYRCYTIPIQRFCFPALCCVSISIGNIVLFSWGNYMKKRAGHPCLISVLSKEWV